MILAANPVDTYHLRLREEIDKIREGINFGKNRDQFEIVEKWALNTDDMSIALLVNQPLIVHFCGHGVPGGILLEDPKNGESVLMDTKSLANLFDVCKDFTKCVFLNSCYSAAQIKKIGKHIDYVIGIRTEIEDEEAIKFSRVFYTAFSTGKSVVESYKAGKASIPRSSKIPTLSVNPNASSTTLDNHSADVKTIPLIIVAMTKTEADELFEKYYKKGLKQLIKSISKGRDTRHFISKLINRYASNRNEWKPFEKDERTMIKIIEELFSQLAELYHYSKRKSEIVIQPEYCEMDFFSSNEDECNKINIRLKKEDCIFIIDTISLFHPRIKERFKDYPLADNKPIIGITPISEHSMVACETIKESIKDIKWVYNRYQVNLDLNCSLEAHSLTSFNRILGSSLNNIFNKNIQARPEYIEKITESLGDYPEKGFKKFIEAMGFLGK